MIGMWVLLAAVRLQVQLLLPQQQQQVPTS
jgi:hypothetical protein